MVRRQVWPYPPLPLPYRLLPRKMSPQTPSFLGAQETPPQTYLPAPLAYGWKQVTPVHALTCRLLPRQVNCPFSNEGASASLRGSIVMEYMTSGCPLCAKSNGQACRHRTPQSQKREFWPVQQRLAAHEFTGVNLGGPPPEKFKLGHLQRSLPTPINHCGGNPCLKVRIRAHPPPSGPALCSQQAGVVWCGIDPPDAQRRQAE